MDIAHNDPAPLEHSAKQQHVAWASTGRKHTLDQMTMAAAIATKPRVSIGFSEWQSESALACAAVQVGDDGKPPVPAAAKLVSPSIVRQKWLHQRMKKIGDQRFARSEMCQNQVKLQILRDEGDAHISDLSDFRSLRFPISHI